MLGFVEKVCIFLLRKHFLAAVALLIVHIITISTSCGSIEHIDQRNARLLHNCDVVEDGVGAGAYDKDFFVHLRQELFDTVLAGVIE